MVRLPLLLQLLRPRQWIKNLFVFAPLVFAQQYGNPDAWWVVIRTAAAFLALSGAVYIFNDLNDRDEDRLHPVKSQRPLASGTVTPSQALTLAAILICIAVALALSLPIGVAETLALYAVGNIAYTKWLKRVALLDILVLASFYVLRVLAGCFALQVMISPWIVLTTFLLAMFLGFGKRYHEIGIENYAASNPNLQSYSRELLDRLVTICACASLLTYAIYAAEMDMARGTLAMVYTVGFVALGIFRYLQALLVFRQGGEPELVLMKDPLMLGNVALWLGACLIALS